MDKRNVTLELRLIKEKLSNRFFIAEALSKTAWNPKREELLPGDRFLVIAPHPDDDVIGCGGTILKALAMKKAVRICYLSLPSLHSDSMAERLVEMKDSLGMIGITDYSINKKEFPDTEAQVRAIIEPELAKWRPDCVLVPSPLENHNQHLMAFDGYVEAMRNSQCQATTAMYEIWGPVIPNLVIDITGYMDKKAKSIAAHASQVKMVDYVKMVQGLNQYRAISSNLKGYAEAFLFLEKKDLLKMFP